MICPIMSYQFVRSGQTECFKEECAWWVKKLIRTPPQVANVANGEIKYEGCCAIEAIGKGYK